MSELPFKEAEKEFDWSEMLHAWIFRARIVFRRLWWVFILTIGAGLGYQAYMELNRDPLYVSSARMIIDGRIELPEGANYVELLSNFWGTQMELMQSPMVKRRAKERVMALHPELSADTFVRISVSQSSDANIFRLVAEGRDPKYTQYFLDALMYEYLNYKKERRAASSENTFVSVMEKVLEYQHQIEDLEQQRLDFQNENNIVFLQEQGNNAGAYLAELNAKAASLRTQLRLLTRMDLKAAGKDGHEMTPLMESILAENDEEFAEARRTVDKLNAELSEFQIYMKPKHPKIIALKREIERKDNMLNIYRRQSVTQLAQRQEQLTKNLADVDEMIDEQEQEALKFSRLLAEFERIGSRLESVTKIHSRLLSSIQQIEFTNDVAQEVISVLEPATPAFQPPGNTAKQLFTGGVAGIALGAGILFVFAVMDSRLVSVDDLTARFDAPVLGIIPLQKQQDGRVEMLKGNDERLMFAESCRNIRSSLLFMDREGPAPKTILITSSVPAEGKSTLTGNLAITLAFASAKILAVDADLRRGHMHDAFGVKNNDGLTGLLTNHTLDPKNVIQATDVEGLDVITCGDYPERPGELLMSRRFDEIFDALKDDYDYILYDCPPVLATDDTPSFATKADAVLFIVRSNYTRTRQIKNAVDTLSLRGIKIRGFILNFVDNREPSHYYYKYYDYYSYRSYKPGAGREEDKRNKSKV
ncbi:GumC family protein [Rubellicoccus peritrichatus]|uniref:non-specific protein-tyrosine kinase n=1 Tax=Rubellicoccus peritrichatus TaxID=3080537 RepID=A0AAQ3LGG2_9BACT|nr:polysaccharide biosynthesis tyrosine autokinase [Puniceicoccus sp. CR14]WOO43420.1 polysaccharide biosynthesis tyrosine autokinase [Puniceicoccus sp. CR14]